MEVAQAWPWPSSGTGHLNTKRENTIICLLILYGKKMNFPDKGEHWNSDMGLSNSMNPSDPIKFPNRIVYPIMKFTYLRLLTFASPDFKFLCPMKYTVALSPPSWLYYSTYFAWTCLWWWCWFVPTPLSIILISRILFIPILFEWARNRNGSPMVPHFQVAWYFTDIYFFSLHFFS